MSHDLTDAEIALLCSIGEFDPSKQTEEKRHDLSRLIAGGYVEVAGNRPAYKLTAKGNKFLGERGAGLNEA
jgi:hypothetical protein